VSYHFERRVAYSPDGQWIAVGYDKGTIRVLNAANGQETRVLQGPRGINSVAYSPDGRFIAAGFARVFNEPAELWVWEAISGEKVRSITGPKNEAYRGVVFSPNSRQIAAINWGNKSEGWDMTIWDVTTAQPVLTFGENILGGLAYSPDGKRIAAGCGDRTIRVYDTASGEEILELQGPKERISGVSYSRNGRRLAAASHDGTVRVWDVASGQEVLALRGLQGRFWSVDFSPDDRQIAAKADNCMLVWETDWRTEARPSIGASVVGFLASPQGDAPFLSVAAVLAEEIPSEDEREALALVRTFFRQHILRAEVMDQIRKDKTINESVRRRALVLAEPCEVPPAAAAERFASRGYEQVERANLSGEPNQWDAAAAAFERATALNPSDCSPWHSHCLVLLAKKDLPGYRQVCAKMLAQFGNTKDAATADSVAYTCVLHPDAGTDAKTLVELAEIAASKEPNNSYYLTTLGAAHYRAGGFKEAVKHLSRAVELQGDNVWTGPQSMLSMAHHRLGHTDEAKKNLKKSAESLKRLSTSSWESRELGNLLYREAEELLREKK
jgi:tetratricopeptide (TPR) repeat protein